MKLRVPLSAGVAIALLAFGAGCAGGHDATEKELAELRSEVARLRASQAALTERLDAVDIERGAFAKRGVAPAASPSAPPASPGPAAAPAPARMSDRPVLDVVRLSPGEGDGDADADPARPVVRAVGDPAAARTTLSNKNILGRPAKKGLVTPASKKPDDAPAAVKP